MLPYPYLGCREFAARVESAPHSWTIPETLRERRDLGMMLLDLVFQNGQNDIRRPVFFQAVLTDGLLEVPELT